METGFFRSVGNAPNRTNQKRRKSFIYHTFCLIKFTERLYYSLFLKTSPKGIVKSIKVSYCFLTLRNRIE